MASDSDGDYNVITYAIIHGNHDNNFTINSTTGVITTVTPLDRETQSQFILKIRASDSMYKVLFYGLYIYVSEMLCYLGRLTSSLSSLLFLDDLSVRTAEVVVVVDILDISEHPPVFLMSNYTAVVYENSAVGTIILVVGTSDHDTVSQRTFTMINVILI